LVMESANPTARVNRLGVKPRGIRLDSL